MSDDVYRLSKVEYRIEYTIQRQGPKDEDFVEIGFGSSGSWGAVDSALVAIESDIQRRMWETDGDMPDPETVDRTDLA